MATRRLDAPRAQPQDVGAEPATGHPSSRRSASPNSGGPAATPPLVGINSDGRGRRFQVMDAQQVVPSGEDIRERGEHPVRPQALGRIVRGIWRVA